MANTLIRRSRRCCSNIHTLTAHLAFKQLHIKIDFFVIMLHQAERRVHLVVFVCWIRGRLRLVPDWWCYVWVYHLAQPTANNTKEVDRLTDGTISLFGAFCFVLSTKTRFGKVRKRKIHRISNAVLMPSLWRWWWLLCDLLLKYKSTSSDFCLWWWCWWWRVVRAGSEPNTTAELGADLTNYIWWQLQPYMVRVIILDRGWIKIWRLDVFPTHHFYNEHHHNQPGTN